MVHQEDVSNPLGKGKNLESLMKAYEELKDSQRKPLTSYPKNITQDDLVKSSSRGRNFIMKGEPYTKAWSEVGKGSKDIIESTARNVSNIDDVVAAPSKSITSKLSKPVLKKALPFLSGGLGLLASLATTENLNEDEDDFINQQMALSEQNRNNRSLANSEGGEEDLIKAIEKREIKTRETGQQEPPPIIPETQVQEPAIKGWDVDSLEDRNKFIDQIATETQQRDLAEENLSPQEKLLRAYQQTTGEYNKKLEDAQRMDNIIKAISYGAAGLGNMTKARNVAKIGATTFKADQPMNIEPILQSDDVLAERNQAIQDLMNEYKLSKPTSTSGSFQQSGFITKGSGDPVRFNKSTGEYTNALTGEQVSPGQVIRDVQYGLLPGSAPTSRTAETPLEDFRISKDQAKDRNQVTKFYDTSMKEYKKAANSAKTVLANLMNDNKLTPSIIRTQMPRMFGEVGNLAESEQKVWEGSSYLPTALQRWYRRFADPEKTLTDDDKKQLKQIILQSTKQLEDSANVERNRAINRMYRSGIPTQYSENYLGGQPSFKPVGTKDSNRKSDNKTIVKKEYSASSDKTRFTYSDGTQEIVDGKK